MNPLHSDFSNHQSTNSSQHQSHHRHSDQYFKQQRFIVGLTGGIGSGKTAVSDWFAMQGIDVIDADVIAHEIVKAGSPTLEKIKQKLGDWVITESGEMNRSAVRQYVFSHPSALIALEAITHPAIRQQVQVQLGQSTSPYTILSAPLLLESADAGLASLCQRVLVVDVPELLQLQRASQRDGQSIDKIKAIMANQLPRQNRLQQADDVVGNEGGLEQLYEQLQPLHEQYLQFARQHAHAG